MIYWQNIDHMHIWHFCQSLTLEVNLGIMYVVVELGYHYTTEWVGGGTEGPMNGWIKVRLLTNIFVTYPMYEIDGWKIHHSRRYSSDHADKL